MDRILDLSLERGSFHVIKRALKIWRQRSAKSALSSYTNTIRSSKALLSRYLGYLSLNRLRRKKKRENVLRLAVHQLKIKLVTLSLRKKMMTIADGFRSQTVTQEAIGRWRRYAIKKSFAGTKSGFARGYYRSRSLFSAFLDLKIATVRLPSSQDNSTDLFANMAGRVDKIVKSKAKDDIKNYTSSRQHHSLRLNSVRAYDDAGLGAVHASFLDELAFPLAQRLIAGMSTVNDDLRELSPYIDKNTGRIPYSDNTIHESNGDYMSPSPIFPSASRKNNTERNYKPSCPVSFTLKRSLSLYTHSTVGSAIDIPSSNPKRKNSFNPNPNPNPYLSPQGANTDRPLGCNIDSLDRNFNGLPIGVGNTSNSDTNPNIPVRFGSISNPNLNVPYRSVFSTSPKK
jgi:hypothetical protein